MTLLGFPNSAPPAQTPDAVDRDAALFIDRSWIVEAPAGSGKTGLLIQRYLKLLASVDHPSQVAALTFTNKAVGELQTRVLGALTEAHSDDWDDFRRLTHQLAASVLQRDAELGWSLLSRPHLLNLRTLDSLCGEIARAAPLLSGGIGYARPLNDAFPAYRRAARTVLMRFGGPDAALNSAIRNVLLHRDGNMHDCESLMAEMLSTREQWGELVPLDAESLTDRALDETVLPRLNETLSHAICAALTQLRQCFPTEQLAEVAEMTKLLATAEGYRDKPNPFAQCAALAGLPQATTEHLDYWKLIARLLTTKSTRSWRSGFNINQLDARMDDRSKARVKEIIKDLRSPELCELLCALEDLPPITYPQQQWDVAKDLFRLLQQSLIELKLLFAAEQVCDFSEISLAARAALQDDADGVRNATGFALRHLLVDEMQDTSRSQYGLLVALTRDWDPQQQTVFLVGDPKQSIYLFRQARVDLFQDAMHYGKLGHIDLGVLHLSANFRSGTRIVQQFNDTFREVFPEDAIADGDVTFSDAVSMRPAADQEGIDWNFQAIGTSATARLFALRDEAHSIADSIVAWNAQPLPAKRAAANRPWKIAVLTRARNHLVEIMRVLAQRNIPVRAIDIVGLRERPEVIDIVAVTRALLHPGDRVAWLAILRAPWCGAGIAHLHALAGGDDTTHRNDALRLHLRARLHLVPQPMQQRIGRTLDVMDAAVSTLAYAPLADTVYRTWRSLGGDAWLTPLERENAQQFLGLLDAMAAENETITAASLDRRLDKLFARADTAPNAVDVLTIHGAKGLEWDLVLVPGMHRKGSSDRTPLLDWIELPGDGNDGYRHVLLAPLAIKGEVGGELTNFISSVRKRRRHAELKRVFYVAATRARTALQLFASPDTRTNGSPSIAEDSLLRVSKHDPEPASTNQPPIEVDNVLTALAAVAVSQTIQRVPAGFDARDHLGTDHSIIEPAAPHQTYTRPQGSYGARVVGNTIHAFVERLANQIATGDTAIALSAQLPAWRPAIHTHLRAMALAPAPAQRATATVLRALTNLLGSEEGRWLLHPHRNAGSETAWRAGTDDDLTRIRLDRSFFAGSAPGAVGDDTLWIVDFKTGDHTGDAAHYLAEQRERYTPQLRGYAQTRLRTLPPHTPIMLALSFPLMDKLICWPYLPD